MSLELGEQYTKKPDIEAVSTFVDYLAIEVLSQRSYRAWVKAQADANVPWAIQMHAHVDIVTTFINFWCDYMDIVSRRRNSGISDVCKILPTSLPVSKENMNLKLENCCITNQKNRPCFEVVSVKTLETPIYIHHSILSIYQTLWSIRNINELINYSIQNFQNMNNDTTLNDICNSFRNDSPEREKLISYIDYILGDIIKIFTENNSFVCN